jgi:hypothetical protein
MLSVNMVAKRFEILDSLRGPTNEEMIDHASQLVEAIKTAYHVNYSGSHRQIDEYELMYVPVPRQTTGLVGFSYFPYYSSAFLCFVIVEVGLVYQLPFSLFSALTAASLYSSSLSCGMEALSLPCFRI